MTASLILRPFAVVEFNEDEQMLVSVVSASWLSNSNTKCAWPTGIGSHRKLISHVQPNPTWTTYPCKLLKLCGNIEYKNDALVNS